MEQLTQNKVNIPGCGSGHLYKTYYRNGKTAIIIGEYGEIGKLSVNLPSLSEMIGDNEFFVKCYNEGELINNPCFETGLFEKIGEPFRIDNSFGTFQLWKLKRNL